MEMDNHQYKLIDFIRIPFRSSPVIVVMLVIETVISSLIPALQIIVTARFIDTAISIFNNEATQSNIVVSLIWILLLLTYQYIAAVLMGLFRSKMNIKLSETYCVDIIHKRAKLEYKHIEDNETWELIERVAGNPAGQILSGFGILLQMLSIVIRVVSLLSVIISQIWWAGLVIIIFTVPLFWLAVRSGKMNYQASKEAAKYSRRAGYLQSVLTGRENVEERTLFSYSDKVNQQYYNKFLSAYHINFKTQRNRFLKMKSASLITVIISIMIAGALVVPLGAGKITIGLFMMFVTSTFDLAQIMSWNLTHITSQLANHREYLKDLTDFYQLSETGSVTDLPSTHCFAPDSIEFRDVSFSYPGTEEIILHHLNLKLHAKKRYAFVGINGAGKTTITKLLTGLYHNYTGEILIDGMELHQFTQSEIKAMFSVVYQDYVKYQTPMRDSIGIGNVRGATDKEIVNAIEKIGLDEANLKLSNGLDTPLGKIKEGGVDLSGGEWQKVAIARSLVNPAPIRILDEPTAALDPVVESEVYKLFGRVSVDKTTIFITHRLGAARLADEILVISEGKVAESGTHDELIGLGGIYAEMFEAQKEWYN